MHTSKSLVFAFLAFGLIFATLFVTSDAKKNKDKNTDAAAIAGEFFKLPMAQTFQRDLWANGHEKSESLNRVRYKIENLAHKMNLFVKSDLRNTLVCLPYAKFLKKNAC